MKLLADFRKNLWSKMPENLVPRNLPQKTTKGNLHKNSKPSL